MQNGTKILATQQLFKFLGWKLKKKTAEVPTDSKDSIFAFHLYKNEDMILKEGSELWCK